MKKQSNTEKYRQDKRIAAFVQPDIKEALIKHANKRGISMSSMIESIIKDWMKRSTVEAVYHDALD